MEKIICNSKLKKIILMMFIVILLFDYIMPTIVFAAQYTVEQEAKELMDAWNKMSNKHGLTTIPYMDKGTAKNIIRRILQQEYGQNYDEDDCYNVINVNNDGKINIKSSHNSQIIAIFNDTAIFSSGGVGDTVFDNSDYAFVSVEPRNADELEEEQENMSEDEKIIQWLMNKFSIQRGTALAGLAYINRDTDITWDENGNIINIELSEAARNAMQIVAQTPTEQEELRDESHPLDAVGGILLEPVFFLVNFVADALMCMLDGIMIDGDFSILPHAMSTQKITYTGQPNYKDTIANGVGFANYPRIRYSPEMIFSGQVPILSIDFISGNGSGTPLEQVRTTIASWYKALRLFAIIGLLSVLIYTGIKVMLSANSKDKAKYKEWILNWFLAVAILFSMHYIMSFIITVTTEVNSLLGNTVSDGVKAAITINGSEDKFKTNLIGLCRYMVQADSFTTKIGYEVMYIALIVYTFKFTVVYLKRVLNMAFLTLIAPLVALMYPIDKMTDGSAQGFDMWIKEYIYNALLQPMHMLMYYVLVSSAVQVAGDNPLYGIVVLAFMTEAEKLLKKIFGFDKAHGGTVGGMGSAFAAGAVASQLGNIAKQLKGGNSKNGNGGKSDNGSPELPPTLKDADNVEENFAGNSDDSNDSNLEEDPESDSNGSLTSAAGAYQDSDDPVADAERARLEEMIADGQIDESELTDRERQLLGMDEEDTEDSGDSEESGNEETSENQEPTENSTEDSSRKNRLARGAKAVGKRLAKPVWDFDKSKKYNGKRLLKNVAKGAAGFAVGSTAAAVQAGISITDGKYNPFEGVASFGAGFAGGSSITGRAWDGAKSIKGTFDQGFHSVDDKGQADKWAEKQRERYHEDWSNRDDVNKIFKDKFGEDQFKKMKENAKTYTDRGYNDPKEVAKLMKASGSLGWDDKKTIATMNFKKQLQEQQAYGAVSDKEKEKKYIDAIIKNNNLSGDDATRVRKQYEEAFKSVAQLNKKI